MFDTTFLLISFILMHISDFFMLKILLVLSDLSLFLSHELKLISDSEGELNCGLKSQFTQNLRGQQSFVFIRQEIFPSEFCRCDVCDVMWCGVCADVPKCGLVSRCLCME